MTEPTEAQKATQFKPGQSGNPAGRKKGARAKLSEVFLDAMYKDFAENGTAVIVDVRTKKPDQYLKVIASILPKEITGEDGEAIRFTLVERRIIDPTPLAG